jgi:hypothetical protein
MAAAPSQPFTPVPIFIPEKIISLVLFGFPLPLFYFINIMDHIGIN